LGVLVEETEPAMLVPMSDHLVAALDEPAALLEREVQLLCEGPLVTGDVLGEQRVEDRAPPPLGEAVLQGPLHEHRLGSVESVRRRVVGAEAALVLDAGELDDLPSEVSVVVHVREQELRLLHVEHRSLEHGLRRWAENAPQPALLERRRDRLEVLAETVVEGEQAGVVWNLPRAHRLALDDREVRLDVVELSLELGGRTRVDPRPIPHVVEHDDRQHALSP